MSEISDAVGRERQRKIIELLAVGLLRYSRQFRAIGSNEYREQPQNSLDVLAKTRLHVPTGSGGEGPQRTGERQEP